MCTACESVWYCDRPCQLAHWSQQGGHANECGSLAKRYKKRMKKEAKAKGKGKDKSKATKVNKGNKGGNKMGKGKAKSRGKQIPKTRAWDCPWSEVEGLVAAHGYNFDAFQHRDWPCRKGTDAPRPDLLQVPLFAGSSGLQQHPCEKWWVLCAVLYLGVQCIVVHYRIPLVPSSP